MKWARLTRDHRFLQTMCALYIPSLCFFPTCGLTGCKGGSNKAKDKSLPGIGDDEVSSEVGAGVGPQHVDGEEHHRVSVSVHRRPFVFMLSGLFDSLMCQLLTVPRHLHK